jgi:hypothetical protein
MAQTRGFRRPVLVLNPRSGSVQVVRDRLLRLWRLLDRIGHRQFGPDRDRRGG